jgi:hypothetical protein
MEKFMGFEFSTREEGSKGVLFMCLKTPTIPKIIVLSKPYNFPLSV